MVKKFICTYMIEVEITLVAAQVILLLVSDKGLFFVAIPCVCPSEDPIDRKERGKEKIAHLDSVGNSSCALNAI